MKMKKNFMLILMCIMICMSTVNVYAGEGDLENYQLVEEDFEIEKVDKPTITPYTKYLMNVQTTIAWLEPGKVGIRADVYCTTVMKNIDITFYLQKKSGSSWATVGTGRATASNVSDVGRSVTATGATSGTYRGKVVARVTDKYGYSESMTGYSGSITI